MKATPANPLPTKEQFQRLVDELLSGYTNRNSFLRWEVDLLLEVEHLRRTSSPKNSWKRLLRSYRNFVLKQLSAGQSEIPRLADYLHTLKREQQDKVQTWI